MKIGVWLSSDCSPEVGGGYSYYHRLIQGLDNYSFDESIELCFIREKFFPIKVSHQVVELHYEPKLTFGEKLGKHIPLLQYVIKKHIVSRTTLERQRCYEQSLYDAKIMLVYYLQQAQCELPNFPFIATNWDIGHRSTWAFPEVIHNGEFELREEIYNRVLSKALMVLCESQAGKEELVRYTRLNPERIRVARLFAGEVSSIEVSLIRQKEILEELHLKQYQYFYYPAQFWAHKNHYLLVKAFAAFVHDHSECRLVLSGSDKGTLSHIQSVCLELGLDDKVRFIGFVSMEIVATLYRNAIAIVMPTLMGPTNMPLLEAMELGCPVICSDFPGHREELSDSAIYVNPLDDNDIHMAMEKMLVHNAEYKELIEKRREISPFSIELTLQAINNHLLEAIRIRSCWGE